MNARFWTWANDGWVKLTLQPGQSLEHRTGGPDDEGYWYRDCRWSHTGTTVTREWAEGGRDCDGCIDHYGEDVADLGDLAVVECSEGVLTPD